MKILNLNAENFMKFAKIELNKFPQKGLLGIFGENESGKSTLGDAIFFALYGQTSKCSDKNLGAVIKWGEEACKTRIDFLIPSDPQSSGYENSQVYTLTREIYSDNTQKAHLLLNNKMAANGWAAVNKAVNRILGFNHNDFRFTSFMAQKEIDLIYKSIQQSEKVINSLLKTDLINNAIESLDKYEKNLKTSISEKMEKKSKLDSEMDEIRELLNEADQIQSKIKNIDDDTVRLKEEIADLTEKTINENQILELYRELDKYRTKQKSVIPKIEELTQKSGSLEQGIKRSFTKTFAVDSDDRPEELIEKCRELILKDVTSIGALKEHLRKIEQARTHIAEKEGLINLLDVKTESLEFIENQIEHKNEINKKIIKIDSELADLEKEKEEACKNSISAVEKNIAIAEELEQKKLSFKEKILRTKTVISEEVSQISASLTGLKENKDQKENENKDELSIELENASKEIFRHGENITRTNNRFILSMFCTLLSFMSILTIFNNDVKKLTMFSAAPIVFLFISIYFQRKKSGLDKEKSSVIKEKALIEDRISQKTKTLESKAEGLRKNLDFINKNLDLPEKLLFSSPHNIKNSADTLSEISFSLFESIDQELANGLEEIKGLIEKNEKALKLDFLTYKLDPKLSWPDVINKIEEIREINNEKEAELTEYLDKLKQEIESTDSISAKSDKLREEISGINKKIEHLDKSIKPFSKKTITEEEFNTIDKIKGLENQIELEKNQLHSMELTLKDLLEINEHLERLEEKSSSCKQMEKKVVESILKLVSENPISRDYSPHAFTLENIENNIEKIRGDLNELKFDSAGKETERAHLRGKLKGFETLQERYSEISEKMNDLTALIQNDDLDLKACPEIRKSYIKTAHSIKAGFIPEFSDYVGKIMAHLTLDRYQKIKIDKDLSIKVFSAEKNDYISPESLSGGTSDQLMLAIRLAFANTLLQEKGKKFLFLDEHLASFDKNRRDACLDILKYLEFSFDQVILISHLSGLENYMNSHIFLNKNSDKLIIKALRP
jgi:exonuclease SbcC